MSSSRWWIYGPSNKQACRIFPLFRTRTPRTPNCHAGLITYDESWSMWVIINASNRPADHRRATAPRKAPKAPPKAICCLGAAPTSSAGVVVAGAALAAATSTPKLVVSVGVPLRVVEITDDAVVEAVQPDQLVQSALVLQGPAVQPGQSAPGQPPEAETEPHHSVLCRQSAFGAAERDKSKQQDRNLPRASGPVTMGEWAHPIVVLTKWAVIIGKGGLSSRQFAPDAAKGAG